MNLNRAAIIKIITRYAYIPGPLSMYRSPSDINYGNIKLVNQSNVLFFVENIRGRIHAHVPFVSGTGIRIDPVYFRDLSL